MEMHDFTTEVKAKRAAKQDFLLHGPSWDSFRSTAPLEWRSVKFNRDNRQDVPMKPGVYAFVVEPNVSGAPYHGFVMYVGIAGLSPKGTLRNRFLDYVREQNKPKRPKIYTMLNVWKDHLHFHFAELEDQRFSLTKLETGLNDALAPPYSDNDFSAEIRPQVRAFRA